MAYEDMVGGKYNSLTVLAIADKHPTRRNVMLFCRCDCGNTTVSGAKDIKRGRTKGCGCLRYKRSNRYPSPIISSAKIVFKERYSDGDLTFDDFYKLSQCDCYYCGMKPSQTFNTFMMGKRKLKSTKFAQDRGVFTYNGIDRVDNTKGHCIDNVVPCCKICNYAKRDMSVVEFKEWVIRVYCKFVAG